MPTEPTMLAPLRSTLVVTCVASLAGVATAFAVSAGMGADRASVILAGAAVLASGAAGPLLALLCGPDQAGRTTIARWGMLAFAGTMVQPMLAAAFGLVFSQMRVVTKQPYWVGCLAGAVVLLVCLVTWAIHTLGRGQRAWEQGKSAMPTMEAV